MKKVQQMRITRKKKRLGFGKKFQKKRNGKKLWESRGTFSSFKFNNCRKSGAKGENPDKNDVLQKVFFKKRKEI